MKRSWSKAVLLGAAGAVLLVSGCQDPSQRFEGPGGARLQPVVYGGTRFGDDWLSIPIEANAFLPSAEPRIELVEVYADGVKVADPQVRIEKRKGGHGYAQVAAFWAPPNARKVEAVLYVHHLRSIFQMNVPFALDPDNRATNKWLMGKADVREVGTTVSGGPATRAPAP